MHSTRSLDNKVEISLQTDQKGIAGDVRDILALRANGESLGWEIGISSKHNHEAVKHPRISPTINIGKQWMAINCDNEYWNDINKVFSELEPYRGTIKWNEIDDKETGVYVPLLKAVKNQIIRLSHYDEQKCANNLVYYLIGKKDFYKAIVQPKQHQLRIQAFNLNGLLNLSADRVRPKLKVPRLRLPNRLYSIDFVENSNNTIRIILDEGWQISMRIHSASTMVETSLKMDVRLEGLSPNVFAQTVSF